MKVQPYTISKMKNRPVRYAYLITVFLLTLTGFGQMPVFKRYYIADIPGLGWLAQFYLTHYIHYLAAIVFLALSSYVLIDYLSNRKRTTITASGYIRGAMLFGLILSGIFLVLRNLEGNRFSPEFIILLDLFHLAMVMTFLMASLYCVVTKKTWVGVRKGRL